MTGRYGNDQLNQLLSIVSVVLLIVAIFTKWTLVYLLAVILIALCYFRMFSRNTAKRYEENQAFLNWDVYKRQAMDITKKKRWRKQSAA